MCRSPEIRDLVTAQHEAAHLVVGVCLGLRLDGAGLGGCPASRGYPSDPEALGYVSFYEASCGDHTAQALMLAAGVAWDRALRYDPAYSAWDWQECRKIVRGRKSTEACIIAASALLSGLGREHTLVTRALLVRDLTGDDIPDVYAGLVLD